MSKHTPGPWRYIPAHGEFEMRKNPEIVDANFEGVAYVYPRNLEQGRHEANAARIVECVNACEGIENPESVKQAIEGLKAAQRMINHLFPVGAKSKITVNWGQTFCDWGLMNESLIAVSKALAALGVK